VTRALLEPRPVRVPRTTVAGVGPLTTLFMMNMVGDLRQAAGLIQGLPYGRNHRRDDPALVLMEGHGTCSSKHACLAALGLELGVDLGLTLGVYRMSAETDPAVGPILAASGVDWLPEAHCYLTLGEHRVDLTGGLKERELELLHEESITPEQVVTYKVAVHRRFIEARAVELGCDPEGLWAIREACISAL
jgi:hypothetical protein